MKKDNEYFEFLDALRESGVTNMFGATPYLEDEFPELDPTEAGKVLTRWMKTRWKCATSLLGMKTFGERHPKKGR